MRTLLTLLLAMPLTSFGAEELEIVLHSPEAAASSHMKALMTRDASTIEQTMFFPFVHTNPDGQKRLSESIDEFPSQGVPYYSELESANTIVHQGDTALVRVILRVHDLDKKYLGRVSAIWGMIKVEDQWLVSWRQLLGRIEEGNE